MSHYKTRQDLECFFGNACQHCGEIFGPHSLTQVGRPIYVDARPQLPHVKFCAFCTVFLTLHNAQYLYIEVEANGLTKDANSQRRLIRMLDGKHDFNDPFNPQCGCIVLLPSQ
jgi:hypothetical protein